MTTDAAAMSASSAGSLPLDQIICGDNCEVMRTLPSASIDLVVTSPPYDELRTYGGHSWDFFGVAWNLKRLLKPGGVIVWVVADATKDGSETGTSMRQALHFQSLGLNLHDTMIYASDKPPVNTVSTRRYQPSFEYAFVLSKGSPARWNPVLWPTERKGHLVGKFRQRNGKEKVATKQGPTGETKVAPNLWWYATGRVGGDRGLHPAPFPERLAKDHILSWSNPGDVVLDPFSGSGTTAKMARETGRHFIGIEVHE
jgi:site-specific DNA-methyltransferase (adenine-specific)